MDRIAMLTWLGKLLLQVGIEPALPRDGSVGCLRLQRRDADRRRRCHAANSRLEAARGICRPDQRTVVRTSAAATREATHTKNARRIGSWRYLLEKEKGAETETGGSRARVCAADCGAPEPSSPGFKAVSHTTRTTLRSAWNSFRV